MHLAQDRNSQVRQAVASNPNTPWPILEHLAWMFPHSYLSNPISPLQMMAHPEQICTDGIFYDALLREASIPPLWWSWLRSQPVLRQRHSLIRGAFVADITPKPIIAAFMPPLALQKLAASPSWEVRYLVALHPRPPGKPGNA